MTDITPEIEDLYIPDELPPAIREALHELDGPTPMPDPARREAVLAEASEHFAAIRRNRSRRLFFAMGGAGSALAAAAAIAIVVYIGGPTAPDTTDPILADTPTYQPTYGVAKDHNGDGVFDIGDGFALARIEQNAANGKEAYQRAVQAGLDPRQFDLNEDNQLTQIDIDQANRNAVDLGLRRVITERPDSNRRGLIAQFPGRTSQARNDAVSPPPHLHGGAH
ncbi:MAG: hypothetical protein AAGH88_11035 [Planctomycetota bacterium]